MQIKCCPEHDMLADHMNKGHGVKFSEFRCRRIVGMGPEPFKDDGTSDEFGLIK